MRIRPEGALRKTQTGHVFRVKICGVTKRCDAQFSAAAGADAVGLNFYSGSRRCVDLRQAAEIIKALDARVAKVGVFVNAQKQDVLRAVESLALDFVQLHGDEPPEAVADLHGIAVIRAFRLGAAGWQPLIDYLQKCRRLEALPTAVLVDAFNPDSYGGTGESADWTLARRYFDLGLELPLILAGGLTPENVADAIAAVGPFGVDTASGVESAPGMKDESKVAAFVAAARQALGM